MVVDRPIHEPGVFIDPAFTDGGNRVAFAIDSRGGKVAWAVIPTVHDEPGVVALLEGILKLHGPHLHLVVDGAPSVR